MAPGWIVHATVDEPAPLVCAFVAHHIALGAALVDLYLDRPAPAIVALLGHLPRVRLTLCDAAHWQAAGQAERPPSHVTRQLLNLQLAHQRMEQDWMLFCDADEFLVAPGGFAETLAQLPQEVRFARISVVERVQQAQVPQQGIFDGIFRRPLPDPAQVVQIYGPAAAALLNKGLSGHAIGKSVLRRDIGKLRHGIHHPRPPHWDARKRGYLLHHPGWDICLPDVAIAHFDGLTPLQFLLKLLLKHVSVQGLAPGVAGGVPNRSPGRVAQIAAVAASCSDPQALRALQDLLWLPPETETALRQIHGIAEIALDPAAAAVQLLPQAGLDFRAPAFDASLRQQHAALIAATGFAL